MSKTLKVAVIDDDPEMVKIIVLLLRSRGYEAVTALSGEEGLELVRREMPAVVLLDIMMPGIDGIETCRRLKSDRSTAGIPVIFVSARKEDECGDGALAAGGSAYLAKPFKPAELFAKICEFSSEVSESRQG